MTPELYEFMQTKLFGLIWALFMVGTLAWAVYHCGYERGKIAAMEKQRVFVVMVNPDGEHVVIDNEGKAYRLTPHEEEDAGSSSGETAQ